MQSAIVLGGRVRFAFNAEKYPVIYTAVSNGMYPLTGSELERLKSFCETALKELGR